MASADNVSVTEPGNDLMLLERVFLRLGNTDTDEQLETCVGKFLPPVLLKLASPHEQVRTKVMELLVHINKRVRCRSEVQLPIDALLLQYQDPKATSFVINFTLIYLTMGYPRLSTERQVELIPKLLLSIASRPQSHQDDILLLVMPMLGELGNKTPSLSLKERPEQAKILLRLALDLLLLPYGALPGNKETGPDFPVPPGMSPQSYKKLTEKNNLTAEQLEKTKQSIVKFLTNDAVSDSETLLPLIVAAADSRFSVANIANVGLGRIVSAVDWSSASVCGPLYTLFLGSTGPRNAVAAQKRAPACTRIRLKLLQYLNRATAAGIIYPHCIQVVFASLFATNTNPRLKTLALNFTINIIQSGDLTQLRRIATVLLGGLLKLTKIDEEWAHHPQAFSCIGRLAAKAPSCINKQFTTLEELFNKMPESTPDLRMAIREALLSMADSFKITKFTDSAEKAESMDVCPESSPIASRSGSSEKMDVDIPPTKTDESKNEGGLDESHATLIVALLDKHMDSEDHMVRFVATRYASVLFPKDHVASKYLLLLASGDNKDEVKIEALKSLYGTSRQTEIEDVVQNVTNDEIKGDEKKTSDSSNESVDSIGVPPFESMVNYLWSMIAKRQGSSNLKHRFVFGNQVLAFPPSTFYEMLRYLRTCLNRSAGIKDGSPHPSASSPLLAKYLNTKLLDSESLQQYLKIVKLLLTACPDIVPFTCLLDIIGCTPQKMSPQFVDQLPFYKTYFTTSMREEVRDTAALLYAIVKAHTANKKEIENDILELIDKSKTIKSLESQCGFITAYSNVLERSISLWKKNPNSLGVDDFKVDEWKPYRDGVLYLVECLSSSQNLLVSTACTNLSLLGKCYALPLPDRSEKDISTALGEKIPVINTANADDSVKVITKLSIVNKLFEILKNAKYTSKIKEKATICLGVICIGENFPFSKDIIKGFLDMAKETKDVEIHLQIGESFVLCVEGINSLDNRDAWSDPMPGADSSVKNNQALIENDKLLEWLLTELLEFVSVPHPNSRQACCIWLLALLKNCPKRTPIKSRLSILQDAFMEFLSENNDIVQDVASKGLSLVYQCSTETDKKELVEKLVEQLAGGKRQVAQVTLDTKVFEEGQLGKTPTGGNLSTYKELCSFASDLNQPDLIYKFMHLANHNAMWNSKKGAAFGFHSIAQQAGSQLSEHLPKIVPRLYRYRFDPTPKIQNSMCSIWHALVPETQKTVEKYHTEILNDIITNLTANQWRIRISCCLALSDLLRVSRSLHDSLSRLEEIWSQLFRVMDDVHEGTRTAAGNTTAILSKLCVRATDVAQGKSGKEIVAAILPVLLNTGITNTVLEVRQISLQTVSKLVSSAGASLKPFLPQLIPALIQATGELESSKLSHLSSMLSGRQQSQEVVDSVRAQAAKSHYTTETMAKCVQYIDITTFDAMLPQVLELMKSPQLGTKVACTHLFILLTHQLGKEMMPLSGKIMSSLLNSLLDRNAAVRKNCADALGNIVGCAKDSSIDKLLAKLNLWYKERDDESVRSAIALTLQAVANKHTELLKEKSNVVMPMLFFAMHAEKTPETTATTELFEEIWSDISPGKEQGIRTHLVQICDCLKESINSPSWTMKTQAANSIATVAHEMKTGLGQQRQELVQMLLDTLKGRTWEGKERLLKALANLCKCTEDDNCLSLELSELVIDSVMRECGKQEPTYKKHCLAALGDILVVLKRDRFEQVYNILHDTLVKDVSSIGKDSDDDENSNEASLKKKEQLLQLKEVAYETLGKAWPENSATQEKYQRVFASHCSECISTNTRSVQVSILTALMLYVEKSILLNGSTDDSNKSAESTSDKMDVDTTTAVKDPEIDVIMTHIINVLDYIFSIGKYTRLRKEALNIMNTLGKNLKDYPQFELLKTLYQKYEDELGKDGAPEIRSRLVNIKIMFQDKP